MKNLVLCVTFNFLLFINTVFSAVQVSAIEKAINFTPNKNFKLICNVTYDDEKPEIEWLKEDKRVTEIDGLKKRAQQPTWENKQNVLEVKDAVEDDAGNYSCSALVKGEEKARAGIRVARTVAVKVPANTNVVEEEKLKIECKVVGNPKLSWHFKNETYTESRDRVILQEYTDDGKKIENGVFIIERITKNDTGNVTCIGEDPYSGETAEDSSMVRVRDKYAALWPFFGICAEVIVLCAIIVIYEKKRNKTELEESDTDQSPDQKNTPDHGKEANLRHRQ